MPHGFVQNAMVAAIALIAADSDLLTYPTLIPHPVQLPPTLMDTTRHLFIIQMRVWPCLRPLIWM